MARSFDEPALFTTPLTVVVADGEVMLNVPALPALTPSAARETAIALIKAADEAERLRIVNDAPPASVSATPE